VQVTIRDVAKATAVSPSTVSRALAPGGAVSAATRDRVRAAADRLGYQPNRAARGLITGRTGHLGVIVPDCSTRSSPTSAKTYRPAPGAWATRSS
jgi:LacI family transcriptional regulator